MNSPRPRDIRSPIKLGPPRSSIAPDLHQLIIDLEKLAAPKNSATTRFSRRCDLTGAYGYNAFGDSLRGAFSDLSTPTNPPGPSASRPVFPSAIAPRAPTSAIRVSKKIRHERLSRRVKHHGPGESHYRGAHRLGTHRRHPRRPRIAAASFRRPHSPRFRRRYQPRNLSCKAI